jgi:GTP-binding protein EngB required for normal cell division
MFHANHQRYLLNQFRSIDKLFSETLMDLQPVDDGRLFVTHIPDASAEQRQILSDHIAQLRFVMRRFMQSQALNDPHKPVSAIWSSRVALSFAATAVEELRPRYLRGYGEMDEESVAAIDRLVADLHASLARMADFLESGESGGLRERLAKLDATEDAVNLLRELARIIGKQGLIELRRPLERLVERVESPRFEVAVFGRVNSGKTSLLNWWLGGTLLPTGVIPVTAVPTRILRGESPEARVTMAEASAPLIIPLGELASFVTEEGNPANRKRVMDLEIRVPAPRLIEGLCLVDTPGLGSLAARGAALTLEYLPRCDLGVLLLEAGGPISREDVDVARAIVDCGANLIVALSKADRLSKSELDQALDYARHRLSDELRFTVQVHPISTLSSHPHLAETWFQSVFESRLAAHHVQSAQAVRRKTAVLREAVMALLQARLAPGSRRDGSTEQAPTRLAASLNAASDGRAMIEQQRYYLRSVAMRTRDQLDGILDALTDALSKSWVSGQKDSDTIQSQLRTAMFQTSSVTADELSDRLNTLLKALQSLLRAHWMTPLAASELSPVRDRPTFEPPSIALPASLIPSRGAKALSPIRRAAARQIVERMRQSLIDRLTAHGDALQNWGMACLTVWAAELDAAVAAGEGIQRADHNASVSEGEVDTLLNDLALLKEWS